MNKNIKATMIAIIMMIAVILIIPNKTPEIWEPHNPATPTIIGDYGHGDPLPQEEDQCLAAGGHIATTTDMWFCEEA